MNKNTTMLLLLGLSFVINGVYFFGLKNYNMMLGTLQTHGELAYNVYKYNKPMLNSKRMEYVFSQPNENNTRIEYSTIDHEQYGQPDRFRSVYDTVGYGTLLGLLWKITGSLEYNNMRFLQFLLFSLLILLVYQTAFLLFSNRHIALTISVVHLFFLPLTFLNSLLFRDIWAYYAVALLLFGLAQFIRGKQSLMLLGLCSLGASLIQLIRPTVVFSYAGFCGALLLLVLLGQIQLKKSLIGICILLIVNGALFWIPFCTYNKIAYDRYLVGPSGIGLLEGLGVYDNPWGIKCDDAWYRKFMKGRFGLDGGTPECEEKAQQLFYQYIKQRPLLFLRNVGYNIVSLIFPSLVWFPRFSYTYCTYTNPYQRFKMQLTSFGGIADLLFHHLFIWIFFLIAYSGLFLLAWSKNYVPLFLLLFGCIAPGFPPILGHIELRYVLPFFSFYIYFAGFAVHYFGVRFFQKSSYTSV